jgi:hypothetical protein
MTDSTFFGSLLGCFTKVIFIVNNCKSLIGSVSGITVYAEMITDCIQFRKYFDIPYKP